MHIIKSRTTCIISDAQTGRMGIYDVKGGTGDVRPVTLFFTFKRFKLSSHSSYFFFNTSLMGAPMKPNSSRRLFSRYLR